MIAMKARKKAGPKRTSSTTSSMTSTTSIVMDCTTLDASPAASPILPVISPSVSEIGGGGDKMVRQKEGKRTNPIHAQSSNVLWKGRGPAGRS